MKKVYLFLVLILLVTVGNAQFKPFRFAFVTDTHIGSPNGVAEEDLRRTVADINQMKDVAFVLITGDVTELGTKREILVAKRILDSLRIPYYVIPGNHDTGWSESGGVDFTAIFGYDRFAFKHNDVHFIGCASGPYVRMSDGHVPREAVVWLDKKLEKIPASQPIIFVNHYPLDNALDNWYEVTDRLKRKNTLVALCGHGHNNNKYSWEGLPGIMSRSNLRAKAEIGGYNLVDVRPDTIIFQERTPTKETKKPWAKVPVESRNYDTVKVVRPDYSVNEKYTAVKPKWVFSSDANVISTPAVVNDLVVYGNSQGIVEALTLDAGKKKWNFKTKGAIYSSPAVFNDNIVVGSGDGSIYAINTKKGKKVWKFTTGASVLGSPIIINGIVYIGGSDQHFRAINATTGKEVWRFKGINGPVVSQPVVDGDKILFGAWDTNLYCLNIKSGELLWKWNNGSPVINYSPAACIPVVKDGVVYVVAPDRYISAIDLNNGKTLWRNNEARVRESIGITEDGKYIIAKTMNDEVVAFATSTEKQPVAWKVNCSYGYDHVPSMLIEKDNNIFFGTKSGVVYAVDGKAKQVKWAYKIDNSMVNTVRIIDANNIIASTMDGKVALITQ